MARPNKARTIGWEANAAYRIRYERERRGWTLDNLATRMAAYGCPVDKSAIFRIENPKVGGKRRTISFDEAVAFARIFKIRVDQLAVPPDIAGSREAKALITKQDRAFKQYLAAYDEYVGARTELVTFIDSNFGAEVVTAVAALYPELADALELEDPLDIIEVVEDHLERPIRAGRRA